MKHNTLVITSKTVEMKKRVFKIGETVLFKGQKTVIKGFQQEDTKLYIVESENGWYGWCVLESKDLEQGHHVLKDGQYSLAFEKELKKVSTNMPNGKPNAKELALSA